jgi:cytochrome c oxidase subunit 4
MASTKLYTAIYVALFVVATAQVGLEEFLYGGSVGYWPVFGAIMVVSFVKAAAVAGYYMHLREEPRAVSYLMLVGLFGALALTIAAAYSIL